MPLLPPVIVERPPVDGASELYAFGRAPLRSNSLAKLPITSFRPGGWVRRSLELQRDGLMGNLGEISVWLTKKGNAWLNPEGKGEYGWEEMPYWLRGYSRVAYVLRDPKMLEETKFWIEGTLASQRPNGDFGPVRTTRAGFRDVWAQMLMIQVLQSWYEYSGDARILPFMTRYYRWEAAIPEREFLKDYWENSRGGDNLASVYWLYDRTGDATLLDFAKKIHRNTANWRLVGDLPNWHNVNIAQGFREPATFSRQSGDPADLAASYRTFDFIREQFGQVPGGMFGADENARAGHTDPHQGVETCGMVEQIRSNGAMMEITGDPKWSANTENVAFNTLPAAFMPDYRSLRYLTAPNMIVSDAANHAPGIANGGPFMLMNPFSSRCCQHNHSSAWVNFLEGTWMATRDGGLAALVLTDGAVTAKVGRGAEATIATSTRYPFEGRAEMTVSVATPTAFPLYLLVPVWAKGARIRVGGSSVSGVPGRYVRLQRTWKEGDRVAIELPMTARVRTWTQQKDAVSVDYGALTFALRIGEEYRTVDGTKTAQGDAGWQPGADPKKWPTYEILPTTPWNYGLPMQPRFEVVKRAWPEGKNPFTLGDVPLEIRTTGYRLPEWGVDQNGLSAVLPKSPVATKSKPEPITLVPMGAARLRISSFPTVK